MSDDLEVPRPSERSRIARGPARSSADGAIPLHELFRIQARRSPEAVALSFGEVEVPYGELDRRAQALARRLAALGVGPECLVGLCVERSVEMVVAILGVLQAGGAYLPLDPDYPEDRLRFMWRDSRRIAPPGSPPVVLTQERLAGRLEGWLGGDGRPVLLDGAAGEDDPPAGEAGASRPLSPRHLAYVIYTSGSTGRPKGVMVEHRGAVNVVRHAARALGVGPGSRVLQLASLSFDASVLEIFTALGSGARLVLTPRETLLSGEALGAELRRREIHTLAIPPSLLDKVPDEVELPALRSIVVGGEACSAATARRWAPGRVFVNAYAPTEATIYTTAGPCPDPAGAPIERAPAMGRPIPGTSVRVLDASGRPVADGEVGELCLGGVGLARGYGGRPGLTAERFVPDPLEDGAERPGARLYRSGDLGRRLPDGSLEFAGRVDHQVKVRGLRIELGEIEAILVQHPRVRQAVVVRREEVPGEPRLVGYLVARPDRPDGASGAGPSPGELRAFLAERLPDPMVPSAFVVLASFPQTATGKIDRRALPAPGPERPDLSAPYVAPEGRLETALSRVWGELLGLDRVGVLDDLFELGGHSLVVAQMVNRVRRELGLELPLQAPFEHPTVRGLAAFLEARIATGTEGRGAGETQSTPVSADCLPPVERAPRDRPIPLSFPQERIWFVQQLAPSAVAYNFQFSLRMQGSLSVPALARTLAELVRRHEVLRTTFPAVDGRPVQEIHPPFPVRMPVVDLSGLPEGEREDVLGRRVLAEVRRGFDVAELPLLRWTLFRLAPDDHLWLQVEHHFVHDGWSLGVYLRELEALYGAFRAGRPSPLPEPEIQYADFARWQRRWMVGEVLEEQLAFWRETLAGSPPVLELPADRPRGRAHGFRGGCLRVDLDPELYWRVRAFGRRQGVTLFMTMLATFDALLYRYTGQEDVVLGSGLANRRLRETEGLVGMVVNTLVVRTRLDGRTTVRELLERVRRTTLDLHLYQDMPFEKLVERLQPDRDLSRNPLFQVLFSFHDAPVPDLDLPGLATELFEWHNGSAKADLNVVVKPVAEQRVGRDASAGDDVLTMVWEYNADLFDRATAERMWGHYRNLLAAVVEDPEAPIDRLPLLSERERQELVVEWNDTAEPYPRERSIGALFEEVAARRPEAVAVHQEGRTWSYAELERRSAALAARLAAAGVAPEALVGITAERSPELIAGLLGIVRAGAAYLPLDPEYPQERLRFMLEDGRAPVLLVAEASRERMEALAGEGAGNGPRMIALEEAVAAGAGDARLPRAGGAGPRSLAYVLYTSGSTGRPKGVAVEHRSVVRLVKGADYADLGEEQTFLQFAPVAFDASTLEIWGALLNGGRLEIPPPGAPSLAELGRGIESSRTTTLWLTAGLFHQMVESELPRLTGVRQLLAGGDALSPPHVARVRAVLAPGGRVINGYGPTEGTTFTCCHPMGPAPNGAGAGPGDGVGGPVPVGRPIANTRVYVVRPGAGDGLEPVPVGVPGELFVGGDGVARGYFDRPALTAAAFVPDPFGAEHGDAPGGRLYRTGDLARWLPGGRVEFLGRIDGQVKLRGFRIELGEIETALGELPEVAEAAVVVRGSGNGGGSSERLVAYAVPREGRAITPEGLRRALEARLPDHMVPNLFVLLDELPLGPTGKVDRESLPDPVDAAGGSPAGRGAERIAPRTPTEELVAGLWERVLGVERAGVEDDFFQVGGHSLLATRLLSRLRDAAGAEVSLIDLFDDPTVAGLARAVEARLQGFAGDPPGTGDGPIPRRGDGPPAPLSFAQERLWFLDRLNPGEAAYNVARVLRLKGPLDAAALAGALGFVARRHEVLRTRFAERGGRPVQVADRLPLPLPVVDLGALGPERAESEAAALARAESRRPFDMARGPLARAALVRIGGRVTGDREHVLLLTFHHGVFDGGSVEIFYRELAAAYGSLAAGARPEIPPPPIQYADFSAWQREHLSGGRLERLLAFWRERLAGAPPALELPADRPRPRMLSGRGARASLALPSSLPALVRALAAERGVTPFLVYAAAFAALVHRYTGRADVVVGTPMANRSRTEIEGLIGFFANSLVLRIDAGGDPVFGVLVDRTREAVLGAHAHQEIPFEKLVEELAPERDLSRSPLFQVSFQMEEGGADRLELPGLAVERLDLARAETKFDLSLAVDAAAPGAGSRGPAAWVQYSTDLFDRTRMLRLLGHLARLLEAAAASPEIPLSHLPLMGPAERLQVLHEWNDTRRAAYGVEGPAPEGLSVPRLFAAHAARTPDAVAVSFEGAQLSYGALAEAVGRWAAHLRTLGVGPDVLVAVCLERSLEMVIGLLAVLEAGGAYVPLDPSNPEERLAFMLDDSGARVVLTLERLRHLLSAGPGEGGAPWAVVCLDREPPAAAPVPAAPLHLDHLAYAIYTSGSTGLPKGTLNTHRGLLNWLLGMREMYGVGAGDRTLQKTPLGFDVSVWELFLPLVAGARLVVARPLGHREPAYLRQAVAQEGVTLLHFVPSMLEVFVAEPGLEDCGSLRWVFAGGEVLSPRLLAAANRRFACGLQNSYGPAEASIGVTHWPCPRTAAPVTVPIGRPIPNARVHLVDTGLRPVPVGVPGELVIGGVPVGRGYLGRPSLTADRFRPDPFGDLRGGRLYRTGDLCRTQPSGDVEYLGRLDFQVKIRGQRIEIGEIESVLRQHPAVREAVVMALPRPASAAGQVALAAFVTPDAGEPPVPSALREHLRTRLPEAMVPATTVVLDRLPLSPNGKVDRAELARLALPETAGAEEDAGEPRVPPRTQLEAAIAGAWEKVLELGGTGGRVGVHDDFFRVGGHSIAAAVLANRLREMLGETVPVVAVFEAPTVAGLAAWVTERLPAAAAAFAPGAARSEVAAAAPIEPLPRPPAGETAAFAPSFAQERLWFLDRMDPGSPVYNLPVVLRLAGVPRPALVERVLNEIVRRHESLRTTFPEVTGAPVQRVHPPAPVPLPRIDLSALPPGAREREARSLARADAARPFDLARGPVFRTSLVTLAEAEHRLLLGFHHVVADGWSIGVFLDELAALHAGAPGPAPPIQYADYAAWQRRRVTGELLEREIAYWRERLAGAPAHLELPADRPRPPVPGSRAGRVPLRFDRRTTDALAALGRGSGATLFMVLLAAFVALLARHTRQRDLVVGTPVAGRDRSEVEGLIGFFVNTLVVRADLPDDPAFADVLAAVRESVIGAFGHQEVPFERLVQELVPERSLGHTPLFQVVLALQDGSRWRRTLEGPEGSGDLEMEVLDSELRAAKFDLVASLGETADGLRGSFQYDADLFDATTVERMAGHFRSLAAAVLDAPAARLSRLPLLSAGERHQVAVEWNDTAVGYPREASIGELFVAEARRRPDAAAVRQGDRWWSYAELERRSARVALRLAAAGVAAGTLVAIAAPRSPELAAGLLGILRSGGAYLPLDPAYPRERLRFILEDGGAPIVLGSDDLAAELAPALAGGAAPRWLSLEVALAGEPGVGAALPDVADGGGAGSLAYVLYTSGSTGKPKGVAVEHRSVVRLVRGTDYVAFGEEDVFLQAAPVPFDASTFEIWGALLNGGRLEVAPPGHPTLAELGRTIASARVTTAWLTAGLFHQMVESELPQLVGVRRLLAGGDVLSPLHVARVRSVLAPDQALVNGYGPTEGTTFTCCRVMGPAPDRGGLAPVPIGRPIANARVYLADPGGGDPEPVPPGMPGELFVGGDGVARGYHARPALTAAAFVPDPFGPPGSRLYRTGDLARRLPDGEIDFLGRIDRQVKLRGFRIEPGEIESALTGHPGVLRAAVLVREDRPGDRRLVAYVVGAEPGAPAPAELRRHLAERLPDPMVPASFVLLDELPLDPNGKLDRRALPAPADVPSAAPERVAPRSALEELVAGVWADVLGVEAVGVHDGFFDLGGHSLLATRVVSRLTDLTGVEVPLREIFEGPTVAEVAEAVEDLLRGDGPRPPPLTRAGAVEAPLSFAQARLWFLDRFDPGSTVYDVPALFRLSGALRVPLLARALGEIVRRHESLRTVYREMDGTPLQRVLPPAPAALPVIDLSGLPAEASRAEAGRVAGRSAAQVFDLARGPVWSAWLLRLAEREHRLAWCVHHVAADGWSLGIVLRELTALYDALSRGLAPPLPEPPVQYTDFAAWQRRSLEAGPLAAQVDYWRRRLDGAPRALELPTDRPRPPKQRFRGERTTRTVDAELHGRLVRWAAGEGATLFMLLLAGLGTVLARWSGQSDLLIGSPVAGRGRSEVEGLVGMFLNSLVLRLELEPGPSGSGGAAEAPTFREVLRRARESALGAYAHQDVPFEMLLEALDVDRELSRTPLFQVFLNVANFPRDRVPLEGLEVEVMETEAALGSKFDLTLYAGPAGPGGESLRLTLVYDADLFDRARMDELIDQLVGLLARVPDDPGRPYVDYPLATARAAGVLPDPARELPAEWRGGVHEVFAARAAEAPDRVAVTAGGLAWTYGALDRASARLARGLAGAGVRRGDRVAILAQRSPALPLAILGTFRAGAGYTILDPAHPASHLASLVERARPRAVLRLAEAGPVPGELTEAFARMRPCLDLELPPAAAGRPDGGPLAAWPAEPPPVAVGPDDEACLTFTSGTTGTPKGIVGRHGPLSHFVPWQRERFGLTADDRYSLLSGLAHDPLQRDVFTPLQLGAALCVPPPDDVLRPARVFDWLRRERVSVTHLTPAMGQIVIGGGAEHGGADLEALRRSYFVGEQLSAALIDQVRRLAPGVECFNYYGTTETQRAVGYQPVPPEAARRFPAGVPLGQGMRAVQLLVLGRSGRPVGIGELGEIAVRSPHLARGYLGDPRLTAERFTPDPFAAGAGSGGGRIYATGDLGRYRPDGSVEFSRRADDQVQIRGFRVELGAVEAALARHPGVKEAAVAAKTGPAGSYLVGYVVAAAGAATPATEVLRAHLAERLPAYMVPGVFVAMEALPLTRTSKLDRRALPDPGPTAAAGEREPPTTPVEELLAEIWCRVLEVEAIGRRDDFFSLGGHSLLATRVVSRLRSEIGLDLPLRTLFERPRLHDLAEAVEALLLEGEVAEAV